MEYAKAMLQFSPSSLSPGEKRTRNPFKLVYIQARERGVRSLYVGCTSLVLGTAVKTSVRFVAFDGIKSVLVDDKGRLTGSRAAATGMAAGVCESLVAVTPFETVKTGLCVCSFQTVEVLDGAGFC